MKYRLDDIPAKGLQETFLREETWLDERLAGDKRRGLRLAGAIAVHLGLLRSGRTVIVRSRIEARVEWLCARCLEPLSLHLASEYTTNLKPNPGTPWPEEIELSREDLETEFYQGEEIDVTSLVQDQVLLALPAKAVCREECRGLCPHCGKNLNRETCTCPERGVDPRLEVLRGFRVH